MSQDSAPSPAPARRPPKGEQFVAWQQKMADYQQALLDAVSQDDIRAIAKALIEKAKGGQMTAIKELLDRTCGRPLVSVDLNADVRGDPGATLLGLLQQAAQEERERHGAAPEKA